MQATDQAFFESYKRLDRLCFDAFSCRNGVTAYIDEMNRCSPRGRRLVPGWEQDLSMLKACVICETAWRTSSIQMGYAPRPMLPKRGIFMRASFPETTRLRA